MTRRAVAGVIPRAIRAVAGRPARVGAAALDGEGRADASSWAGLLLAGLTLTAVAPAHAAEPIRIGCLAALSGSGADIGNRLREGAELAVAAHPEIAGRKVELVVRDSRSDPTVAQQQAASLAADGVSGLT